MISEHIIGKKQFDIKWLTSRTKCFIKKQRFDLGVFIIFFIITFFFVLTVVNEFNL